MYRAVRMVLFMVCLYAAGIVGMLVTLTLATETPPDRLAIVAASTVLVTAACLLFSTWDK